MNHSHDRLISDGNFSTSCLCTSKERGAADAPEVVRCRELASQHTATFIDEALAPYFGSLISFVRDVESRHNRSGAPGASSTSGWDSADGRPGSNRTEEGNKYHLRA